jgi:hypothetical protein
MILVNFINQIDRWRADILRYLLKINYINNLFYNRSQRIFFRFNLYVIIAFILSWTFPLWILIIGPIVFGIPHIVASFRFLQNGILILEKANLKIKVFKMGIFISAILLMIRLLKIDFVDKQSINFLELVGTALFVFYISFISSAKRFIKLGPILIFAVILILSQFYSLQLIGFLILFHNLIPFIYWLRIVKDKENFKIALWALMVFIVLSILIMGGIFDLPHDYLMNMLNVHIGSVNFYNMAKAILPQVNQGEWYFRLVVLYSFGQSLHYFLWLNIIPDYKLKSKHTISFKQSLKLINLDCGQNIVWWVLGGGGIFLLLIFVSSLENARNYYFSFAAIHGYLEIVSIPLINKNT